MALLFCVIFMALSFFYAVTQDGIFAGVFLILSAISYMNHIGGSSNGPDDQRMA